jgi:AcrR family transcriptional regulator
MSDEGAHDARPGPGALTGAQLARRDRMLSAAGELALEGGWDGVQMREVAARSGVALGTLYRYFPSKEHLLVSVMLGEVEQLAERLAVRPPEGDDRVERVVDVLRRANRALQKQPQVTVAMIRALVAGNTDVAPVVQANRDVLRRIIADAMGVAADGARPAGGADSARVEVSARDVLAIDLLGDVWLAALVSWISGVESPSSVVPRLEDAARLLLS